MDYLVKLYNDVAEIGRFIRNIDNKQNLKISDCFRNFQKFIDFNEKFLRNNNYDQEELNNLIENNICFGIVYDEVKEEYVPVFPDDVLYYDNRAARLLSSSDNIFNVCVRGRLENSLTNQKNLYIFNFNSENFYFGLNSKVTLVINDEELLINHYDKVESILLPYGYLDGIFGTVAIDTLISNFSAEQVAKILKDYSIICWNGEYIKFKTKKDYELVTSKIHDLVEF